MFRCRVWTAVACVFLLVLVAADGLKAAPAFADDQVFRASDFREFPGGLDVLTGDVVYITLLTRRAVVVTFSADMAPGTNLAVGLSVNSGQCAFYGPAALSSESQNHTSTLRWVVNKDEVSLGKNRFEVCVRFGTGAYDLRTLTVERPQ